MNLKNIVEFFPRSDMKAKKLQYKFKLVCQNSTLPELNTQSTKFLSGVYHHTELHMLKYLVFLHIRHIREERLTSKCQETIYIAHLFSDYLCSFKETENWKPSSVIVDIIKCSKGKQAQTAVHKQVLVH